MSRRALTITLRRIMPWAWLAISVASAAVIVITEMDGLWLAVWIAATLGAVTYVDRARRRTALASPDTKDTP